MENFIKKIIKFIKNKNKNYILVSAIVPLIVLFFVTLPFYITNQRIASVLGCIVSMAFSVFIAYIPLRVEKTRRDKSSLEESIRLCKMLKFELIGLAHLGDDVSFTSVKFSFINVTTQNPPTFQVYHSNIMKLNTLSDECIQSVIETYNLLSLYVGAFVELSSLKTEHNDLASKITFYIRANKENQLDEDYTRKSRLDDRIGPYEKTVNTLKEKMVSSYENTVKKLQAEIEKNEIKLDSHF